MKFRFIGMLLFFHVIAACTATITQSDEKAGEGKADVVQKETQAALSFGGYANQVDWGKHLVDITGCHDCHTPKKMGPRGPEFDSSKALSGHQAGMPALPINRKEIEQKGLAVTNDLTVWAGPWGVSYAANLTSDQTGIGSWSEDQFLYALRNGITKGLPGSRPILPPMPWEAFRHMSDDEIKAIFAYLKSTNPINNIVPLPQAPALSRN